MSEEESVRCDALYSYSFLPILITVQIELVFLLQFNSLALDLNPLNNNKRWYLDVIQYCECVVVSDVK